jgi:hypothetical protein
VPALQSAAFVHSNVWGYVLKCSVRTYTPSCGMLSTCIAAQLYGRMAVTSAYIIIACNALSCGCLESSLRRSTALFVMPSVYIASLLGVRLGHE